jgi:hypothetical protein
MLRTIRPNELVLALVWLLLMIVLALVLGVAQRGFGAGRYQETVTQSFQGRLTLDPYPALQIERPLLSDDFSAVSIYPLVSSRSRGFSRDLSLFENQIITVDARLLSKGPVTLLEVDDNSFAVITRLVEFPDAEPIRDLAPVTLLGEILDVRGHLGFHEPERGDLMRSSATSALRAGVPPVLVVEDRDGWSGIFLIVGEDGRPLQSGLIGRIAVPVEVKGTLAQWGGFPVIKTQPASIKRLWPWD